MQECNTSARQRGKNRVMIGAGVPPRSGMLFGLPLQSVNLRPVGPKSKKG